MGASGDIVAESRAERYYAIVVQLLSI
eukprot:COSAG01_NODE_54879_length_329_cov_0.669565_2_plen_26_part_01